MLSSDTFPVGKYKGKNISQVLRDRKYCEWLIKQDWFKDQYSYLFNKINDYNPLSYFMPRTSSTPSDFLEDYEYFNLTSPEDLEIELSDCDQSCYKFYIEVIQQLQAKIYERMENDEENPYDIKAPTSWLKTFEQTCGIPRDDFKEFMNAYGLLNITSIVERIKKEGGIEYKGAKSFIIAKQRSLEQEEFWEKILKQRYDDDITKQHLYESCIFDFLNISTNTIFECKLGMKDFNEVQHDKYVKALKNYRIIYLISNDCVIDMERRLLITTNPKYYQEYQDFVTNIKDPSYLDLLITDFTVQNVDDLYVVFGNN